MQRVIIELHPEGGQMPRKAHDDDAAFDCYARLVERIDEHRILAWLGFRMELPEGWFADIRPRSSIHTSGLILSNSAGIIDAGFRGEVRAVFYQIVPGAAAPYKAGDRVAQMMIRKLDQVSLKEGLVKDQTTRGTNGFGSTGR